MKIKLNVTYHTEWGQTLATVVTWHYKDGSQRPAAQPMQSDDGRQWALTLEPATGRTRQLEGITYYYIVTDNRGTQLRREASDRSFPLTPTHNYIFRDSWTEQASSADGLPPSNAPQGGSLTPVQVPLFQQTLLFLVEAPTLKPNEALGVLGNHPALGAWQTGSYLKMEQTEDHQWLLAIDAYQLCLPVEYKYVVVNAKTGDFLRWEDGYNRTTGTVTPESGEVLVLHGEPLRTPEPPFVRLQQLVDWAQQQGLSVILRPTHSPAAAQQPGPRVIVFDLDGTLLDTLQDLMQATNHALRTHQMPEHSLEEIRQMVGNGVKRLIERAVPEGTTAEDREAVYATFRTFYLQHSQDHTRPYPGIMAMLAALHAAGCQMAVVSNKMQAATQQLVSRFFAPYISVAVGEDEATGIRRKPAPDMVAEALRQLGARAADAVYVGDSDVDIATATNSGLPCISVLWGFRDRQFLLQHGATRLVEQPDDIVKLFSK